MLSQGTPMLLAGDEFRRTQLGNNNAYCQDNEISWVDWSLLEKERELFRFFREMIRFRKAHSILRRSEYFWGERDPRGWSEIAWHGIKLNQPDWSYDSHSLAFTLSGFGKENDIHAMINQWTAPLEFELPNLGKAQYWYRSVDTSLTSPDDIADEGNEKRITSKSYKLQSQSIAVLISR
jgi:isoamylase